MYIIKHKHNLPKLYLSSYTMNIWTEDISKALRFDLKVPDKNLPIDSVCIDENDEKEIE